MKSEKFDRREAKEGHIKKEVEDTLPVYRQDSLGRVRRSGIF